MLRLSRVWLFVTLWTVAHQSPLSMGILQARILEWIAMPSSSRGSLQPRDWTVSRIAGRFFTSWATREALVDLFLNCLFYYIHLCVCVCNSTVMFWWLYLCCEVKSGSVVLLALIFLKIVLTIQGLCVSVQNLKIFVLTLWKMSLEFFIEFIF